MSVPSSILTRKPKEFGPLEVRCIRGFYYVYRVTSKWDPEKRRSKKITGESIGKITEADGFIPNATGLKLMKEMNIAPASSPIVKAYGAYEMLRQLSPEIEERLKRFFPDCHREIRTFALLRLVDGTTTKMMQEIFQASYMSDLCPDIAVSEISVRKFISVLGSKHNETDGFLKEDVLPGTHLLFDGTSIFSRSSDSLSAKGYNPDHSTDTQSRLLYIFDKSSRKPVFYRVIQGSVVDKSAFLDTIRDCGCTDCVIIADKGFYSKRNLSYLMTPEYRLKFILPLQDNTALVPGEFYSNPDDRKFDGVFVYKKRTVWYKKEKSGNQGNWIYTFRDDARRSDFQARFVECAGKEYGEEEFKPMDVLDNPRFGYFSFCSNMDVEPEEIYLSYKQRWDIEECFDYLKNSVIPSASYAHSDEFFRGWCFLNHVSLLYFYGLLNKLRTTKLDDKYSPEDVLKLTKNIYEVNEQESDTSRISHIQRKTSELLTSLGVDLLRNF